jgi:hypothetical protein
MGVSCGGNGQCTDKTLFDTTRLAKFPRVGGAAARLLCRRGFALSIPLCPMRASADARATDGAACALHLSDKDKKWLQRNMDGR